MQGVLTPRRQPPDSPPSKTAPPAPPRRGAADAARAPGRGRGRLLGRGLGARLAAGARARDGGPPRLAAVARVPVVARRRAAGGATARASRERRGRCGGEMQRAGEGVRGGGGMGGCGRPPPERWVSCEEEQEEEKQGHGHGQEGPSSEPYREKNGAGGETCCATQRAVDLAGDVAGKARAKRSLACVRIPRSIPVHLLSRASSMTTST